MVELELFYEDGQCAQSVYSLPLTIGRDPECGLVLRSWRVAKQHARLFARAETLYIDDMGSLAGTFLNGRRITQQAPLSVGDELIVGPCRIQILRWQAAEQAAAKMTAKKAGATLDRASV